MRVRGHSAVLWRRRGESQIGTEPGYATVVTGLSSNEQRLLDGLSHTLEVGSVYHTARQLQVLPARARQVLEDLENGGALVPGPWAGLAGPDATYWERLGLDTRRRAAVLASATVALLGRGPLLQETALWLAEAGVGTVLSAARPEDGGADQVVESRFPAVRTRAPLRTRPDLVLTVDSHVVEPVQARRLAQEGLIQLPVVVREVSVRIGPVLGSPAGPCATCLDLWERDSDPCWPALATQMRTLPPPQAERLLEHQAAAMAARAAIDTLLASAAVTPREREPLVETRPDERGKQDAEAQQTLAPAQGTRTQGPRAWDTVSIELTGQDPAGTRRCWTRHAQCLCSEMPPAANALGPAGPAGPAQ